MLSLLLDAHISPKVVEQIVARRPHILIHSLRSWRGGALLEADDAVILAAANEEGLTLVTYDQRTIVPRIVQRMEEERTHAGVLFVDERSILQEDIGGQVRALIALWEAASAEDWTNMVMYLKPASR